MKQLVFTDIDEAVRAYKKLPNDNKCQIIIRDAKDKRSIEQNNLYWVWVGIISDHTGNSSISVSEDLKEMFLPLITITLFDGRIKEITPSTTSLGVKKMQIYLDQVDAWCCMFCGFALPKTIYTETR